MSRAMEVFRRPECVASKGHPATKSPSQQDGDIQDKHLAIKGVAGARINYFFPSVTGVNLVLWPHLRRVVSNRQWEPS